MAFCYRCGEQIIEGANFCNKCGNPISTVTSPAAAVNPMQAGSIVADLENLGVKAKIILEVARTPQLGEAVLGSVPMHFKQTIIFTNFRIVSVCRIPGIGMNTEWGDGWKIVLMGGNFQHLYSQLSALNRAPSRIRRSHAGGHGVFVSVIKAIGPSASKAVYPYEFQLFDLDSKVINRIYGVTSEQASAMANLAAQAGVKVLV